MTLRIDVQASCLSLSTALMILQITRDLYLAFNYLIEKRRKDIKLLHLELLNVFLKYCQGKNEFKHIIQ